MTLTTFTNFSVEIHKKCDDPPSITLADAEPRWVPSIYNSPKKTWLVGYYVLYIFIDALLAYNPYWVYVIIYIYIYVIYIYMLYIYI